MTVLPASPEDMVVVGIEARPNRLDYRLAA